MNIILVTKRADIAEGFIDGSNFYLYFVNQID